MLARKGKTSEIASGLNLKASPNEKHNEKAIM